MVSVRKDGVIGFEKPIVESWLQEVTSIRPPVEWRPFVGGNSNLTYEIRDSVGRRLVIRRPPLGPSAPRAHDMWREFRIIEALWPTAVPVPEPVAYCDDRAVAESHFYVMGHCPGEPLHDTATVERLLPPPVRGKAGADFVDALARLHAIEPGDIGLGDLGPPDGYLIRQIDRWYGDWLARTGEAGFDDRRVHELHDRLLSDLPPQLETRLVHGDYGPHNALFEPTGSITAVLDWEIATLGDPLADLAYSMNAWVGPGDRPVDRTDPPTSLAGFPDRDDLVRRYVATTKADMHRFAYYRVFNFWKRACILLGVYVRYRRGQKSSEGVDVAGIPGRIDRYLQAATQLRA